MSSAIIETVLKKEHISQFLPKDLIHLNESNLIVFKGNKLKTAYLIDIIHNLLLRYWWVRDNYFNISSQIFREKYGTYYNHYIDFLLTEKIITLESNYFSGKKTRTYSINSDLLKSDITRINNTDNVLLKKWRKGILNNCFKEWENSPISPNLKQKLINDIFAIDIDYQASQEFVKNIQDHDIYNINLYNIDSIVNKELFFNFDNYGRFHSNFTILKSEIRKNCLSFDGLQTKEIDLQNSQPLFFLKILEKHNFSSTEFQLFKNLVLNGTLYQFIGEKLNIKTKKDIKVLVYRILFGKNLKNKENAQFKFLFPNIHNFIVLYKQEKNDYKALAYELQKQESNFIYNKIVSRVYTEVKNIKLFTIHDSISFPEKNYEQVNEIFLEEKNKLFVL